VSHIVGCIRLPYPDLWKVSIPDDQNLKQKLQMLVLDDELSRSTARLSTVFSDVPEEAHLHIVVKAPPGGECRCSCIFVELMITLLS